MPDQDPLKIEAKDKVTGQKLSKSEQENPGLKPAMEAGDNNEDGVQIFKFIILAGVLICIATYALGIFIFKFGEQELINWSNIWVLTFVFGLSGQIAQKIKYDNAITFAALTTIGFMGLLNLFFQVIWPML